MSQVLKVTLLVDAMNVPCHVGELAAWINQQPHMLCSVLVVPVSPTINYLGRPAAPSSGRLGGLWARAGQALLWSLLLAAERRRLRRTQYQGRTDALVSLPLDDMSGGVGEFAKQSAESTDDFLRRLRASLNASAPDVIVQCGSFLLATELASCARCGLLDISYGNNPRFRGGPPGFWEVFFRADKTGFLIHQWLDKLGRPATSGNVLMEGYLPTQGFYLLNQACLVSQATRHLQAMLTKLALGTPLPPYRQTLPFDGKVKPSPSSSDLLAYIVGVGSRVVWSRIKATTGVQEQWGVHYAPTDWKHLVLDNSKRINNPAGGYYADPFIHNTAEGRFCFVEEFRNDKCKGEIAVLRLDGDTPVALGTVIEEAFHLSFPFLFEYEGTLYMCPEAHSSGQIRIYRCNQFPLQWQLHSVVMDAVAAVDTMIFPAHGVWWLMASFHPFGDTDTYPELHIFSAPDPLSGQWVAHAQNPLIVDPEFARNAGLLRDGDKIYRVSQARSFNVYGAWANVAEVKELGPDRYQEDLVSQIKPSFDSRITGLHHLQSCEDFTVWDQKQWARAR